MDGVTPGTYHHVGGSSTVGSIKIGCSFVWLGGGAACPTASRAVPTTSTATKPVAHRHGPSTRLRLMIVQGTFELGAAATKACWKISSTGRLSHSVCVCNPKVRITVAPVSMIDTG